MKKHIIIILVFSMLVLPHQRASAQLAIAEIIKAAVKKVIKAVDLKIQRLQNRTIWLQNAQKTIENSMSKLKLDEITDWVKKQKELYQKYFDELKKVKAIIAQWDRIREITGKQVRLVAEYHRAWGLFRQDGNFNPDELAHMGQVYDGIISESLKNIDRLFLVVNSFRTQMTDAERMGIINGVADELDGNYNDLKTFNQQGIILSMQRAKDKKDVDVVKKLYGLP